MARFARAYATWERTVAAAPEGNKAILRAAEDALGRAFHAAIDATWADAYRLGYGSRAGGAAPALPPSFLGDIDRQRRFATAFAQDIAAGTVGKKGRMPFGQRAGLYANGIEGAFNAGAVDAGVEGELIYWRLGVADHCPVCPLLASSSPYTRATLPTVPRAGSTPCQNQCRCFLEFAPTAGRRAPPPAPTSNPDDVLNPPPPGPGQRRPTPEEEARLRDLEIAAQEAARKAANAKRIADREKWRKRADDAKRERDRIADEGNIAMPPGLPAEAVITGATIGEGGIMDLVRASGIDGPTAARGRDAVEKAITGSLTSLAGLFAALAAFGTGFVTTVSPNEPEEGDEGTLLREAVGPVDGGARVLVSVVGEGLEGTLRNHLEALRVLAAGGHAVEVGPYGARWPELVAALGTWVVGTRADVDSFLTEWGKSAYGRSGLAVAPWRERA